MSLLLFCILLLKYIYAQQANDKKTWLYTLLAKKRVFVQQKEKKLNNITTNE